MKYNIKITTDAKRQLFGTIEGYDFSIKVGHGRCIDKYTLEQVTKSNSCNGILSLSMSKESEKIGGNPYLPSLTKTMTVYARYSESEGWDVLNSGCIDLIRELVKYMERRMIMREM